MITEIKIPHSFKKNWIDQNGIVFGYDDSQHCCEAFGWGVFNPETREEVATSPTGLPYHFDFEKGAVEVEGHKDNVFAIKDTVADSIDVVHVELVSDTDNQKRLVFECFNIHNGYYYHDFSFSKKEKH